MKERTIRRVIILASLFASFVVYLCVSVVNITPVLIFAVLCAAADAFEKPPRFVTFASIKLKTQKAE